MKYDPREVINLLRSPFVDRPLSQLHSGEKDGIVPSSKARSLQAALVGWLKDTGSSYATAVAQRRKIASDTFSNCVLSVSLIQKVSPFQR